MNDDNKVIGILVFVGWLCAVIAAAWFLNEIASLIDALGGFPIP